MLRRLARFLLLACLPLSALAQDWGYPSHQHGSLFFRGELGGAYLSSSASNVSMGPYALDGDSTGTLTMTGAGLSSALAVGAALSRHFDLAGQVWEVLATNPQLGYPGYTFNNSNTTVAIVGVGLMLNWYFPNNSYIAITPSACRLAISNNDSSTGATNWGFGGRVAIGKEWPIGSSDWGLGLAAVGSYSSNQDQGGDSATFQTYTAGVNFSASYH